MKTGLILIILLVLGVIGFVIFGTEQTEQPPLVDEVGITEETPEAIVSEDDEAAPDMSKEAGESEATERVFTLDSFNFGFSETELRVQVGDTVTINLTNSDGFHDWVIDEFGAATTQIQAGGTTSVTFVADQAGEFEYYCSVGSHRANGMVGTLIVE